jgi:hypothetical protein
MQSSTAHDDTQNPKSSTAKHDGSKVQQTSSATKHGDNDSSPAPQLDDAQPKKNANKKQQSPKKWCANNRHDVPITRTSLC